MPRSTAAATRRQAAQAKAADEGVRLPTDVYEDLMKRAKRCSALEKYAAELEATLKHKEKIIRDQGSDWNEVYSKLESMVGEMREFTENMVRQKELEEEAPEMMSEDQSEDMQLCDGYDFIIINRSVDKQESGSNHT
jgi:hypothetical protein